MKRFKDCSILCVQGQSESELAGLIEDRCIDMSYHVEKSTAFQMNDTMSVTFDKKGYPICRLVLFLSTEESSIKIINIVPDRKSHLSFLDIDEYNRILDCFRKDILLPIKVEYGNEILETSASYTIEEIIPVSSKYLKNWLDAYPLSGNNYDQERWFDFLISLVKNDESLSLDDFAKYIREYYNWCDEDIENFELKLEEELALLKYYNEHR